MHCGAAAPQALRKSVSESDDMDVAPVVIRLRESLRELTLALRRAPHLARGHLLCALLLIGRTYAASRSEMDTDSGGDGSGSVGNNGSARSGGGGGGALTR